MFLSKVYNQYFYERCAFEKKIYVFFLAVSFFFRLNIFVLVIQFFVNPLFELWSSKNSRVQAIIEIMYKHSKYFI